MDIKTIEKQFHLLVHFLWMILGASITFLSVSIGNVVYGEDWSGFGNYVGGIWATLVFLSLLPGLYLLFGRRWKSIPLFSRANIIFGYFVAGWLMLVAIGFIMSMPPAKDYYILLVSSAIIVVAAYIWVVKRTSIPRDEMFP